MSGASRRTFMAGICAGLLQVQAPPKLESPKSPAEAPARHAPELPPSPPVPAGNATGPYAGMGWKTQYLFDEDEAGASINDFQMVSEARGMAIGTVDRRGKEEHFVLQTRDGGQHWTSTRIKNEPLSLFMLDESRAYVVGSDDLWYSADGGGAWQKRKLPKEKDARVLRVYFQDDRHGWAFGTGKIFQRTEDGGLHWEKVPEPEQSEVTASRTLWSWMAFVSPKDGFLVGHSEPSPKQESIFPDWMVPERATRRKLTPSSTVVAETRDGGKTWKTSVASTFGRAERLRLAGRRGLVVYHYGDGIEFPAEVFDLDLAESKTAALFRRKDLMVTDAVPLSSGGALVAGIEPPGRMRNSPIPGRLRVVWRGDGGEWVEMRVDYRAVGRRAFISRVDDGNIWVATDEGAILKLSR